MRRSNNLVDGNKWKGEFMSRVYGSKSGTPTVHGQQLVFGCRGFTLVELLVVIAIIGILVALLLPAIQAAREAARRSQCLNNLKQMSLASANFESTNNKLPPSRMPCQIGTWAVALWPYVEQQSLADAWDHAISYYRQSNDSRIKQIGFYYCPSRRTASDGLVSLDGDDGNGQMRHKPGALGDYACSIGNGEAWDYASAANGAFATDLGADALHPSPGTCNGSEPTQSLNSGFRYAVGVQHITDGTSNTFLFGEKHVPLLTFLENGDLVDAFGRIASHDTAIYNPDNLERVCRFAGPGYPLAIGPSDSPPPEQNLMFGSSHPGVVQFALCDGSARTVSVSASTEILGRLSHRADGQTINDDF